MFNKNSTTSRSSGRQRGGFAKTSMPPLDDDFYVGCDGPFGGLIVTLPNAHSSSASDSSSVTMDEELRAFEDDEEECPLDKKCDHYQLKGKHPRHVHSGSNYNKETIVSIVQEKRPPLNYRHITTPHNIQSESPSISLRHTLASRDRTPSPAPKKAPRFEILSSPVAKKAPRLEIFSSPVAAPKKAPVARLETFSTLDTFDIDEDEMMWWNKDESPIKDDDKPLVDSTDRANHNNVNVTLEDFDFDHLNFFLGDAYVEEGEESTEDGERWIVKQLRRNASSFYWLQLTKELEDPDRLSGAMLGNTKVRNVTLYPAALKGLRASQVKLLVTSICKFRNLKNLIVFQDGGSLFLDPLRWHRPPLTRLTLYKLDLSAKFLLSQLGTMLKGMPLLEELSLEKYQGSQAGKVLMVMAEVLPFFRRLGKLSLTPARSVKISTNGALVFFCELKLNRTIKTLSLQGSEEGINQACINELVKSLKVNSTLEELKMTGFWRSANDFWKRFEQSSKVEYLLSLNRSGIRNLHLDVNVSFDRLMGLLHSKRDNLDHVYYLLLNNPSMIHALVVNASL